MYLDPILLGVIRFVVWLICATSVSFFLFSALSVLSTTTLWSMPCLACLCWEANPPRRAVGHTASERELERHRHLNDLLPSPLNASTHARAALHRDIQDVYKHRRVWQRLVHVLRSS
jgi:hypothetical protein